MTKPYTTPPAPARPLRAPVSDQNPELEGADRYRVFPSFYVPGWSTLDMEHDVRDDDTSRDRVASLYDRTVDDAHRGTLTHYVTDDSYAANHRPNNPGDPRWRCGLWHELARSFVGSVEATICDAGLRQTARSVIVMSPPTAGKMWTFTVLCPCSVGGVDALNFDNLSPCGWCIGCTSTADVGGVAVESWVYFVQATTGGPVKIGRSASPRARVASLQTANPSVLRIVAVMPGGATVERAVHIAFASDRVRADSEWFNPSSALSAFVKELGGRVA